MNAIVVYESLWGNTAEVARAVAEGIGPGARALRVDEAGGADAAGSDLIVAGAPVFGFKLSSPQMRDGIRKNPGKRPAPTSCPPLCTWLEALRAGSGVGSRVRHPGARPVRQGCARHRASARGRGVRAPRRVGRIRRQGAPRPAQEGEVERARAWGEQLARALEDRSAP